MEVEVFNYSCIRNNYKTTSTTKYISVAYSCPLSIKELDNHNSQHNRITQQFLTVAQL